MVGPNYSPGKTLDQVIEEAIDAANCVVVIWSKSSVTSSWVRAEADEGKRRGILVPIMIEDVRIPLAFRQMHAAQLLDWDGVVNHPEIKQVFKSVGMILGKNLEIEARESIVPSARRLSSSPLKADKGRSLCVLYSHKDMRWLEEFLGVLKPFIPREAIIIWDDFKLKEDTERVERITHDLMSSSLVIMLVSSNFLASDFISEDVLPPLLDRAHKEGVRAFWLAVSVSLYKETKIHHYSALNDPSRPLISLSPSDVERELVRIAKAIKSEFMRVNTLYPES